MAADRRTALITGASQGIGRAIAQALISNGDAVVLVARTKAKLEALIQEHLGQEAGQIVIVPADVTRVDQVREAVELAIAHTGRLDIVVNNAGMALVRRLEDIRPEEWRQSLDVNLTGAFLVTQAALPYLKPGAVIVNMLSVAARTGFSEWSAYSAAKAGLDGFSRALREELRPRGIRVTCILPAATDTALWEEVSGTWSRDQMMQPETVAQAVLYAVNAPPDVTVEEVVIGHVAGRL